MVGERDAGQAHVRGDLGVLNRLDALKSDRTVPDRLEELHVLPRQLRVELPRRVAGELHGAQPVTSGATHDVGELDRLRPKEVPGPARMDRAVEDRVQTELRRQREPAAHVALATADHHRVDGDHDRLVAGERRSLDQLLHQAPVLEHVDLEPSAGIDDRVVTPLGFLVRRLDLLDRACGHGGQRVRDAGPGRGAAHGQLALAVGDTAQTGGRQDQRQGHRPAQHLRRGVDVGHVSKHPGPKLPIVEPTAVAVHGELVLGATVDVVEHPTRQAAATDLAKVVDIGAAAQASFDRIEFELAELNHRSEVLEHGRSGGPQITHDEPTSASDRSYVVIRSYT